MLLDLKTLYLLNAAVAFVMAAVSLFYWHEHHDMPGLPGWAAGLCLGGMGAGLLGFRDARLSELFVLVGSCLLIGGFALLWISMRRFNGRSLAPVYVLLPVGLVAALTTALMLSDGKTRMPSFVVATTLACLALLVAWEVFRDSHRDHLRSRLVAALAFILMAMGMAVRAASAVAGEAPPTDPFQDPTRMATLFLNTIGLIAATFGLMMMASERLGRRLERLASIDELTGLLNRRCFLERGETLWRHAAESRRPACILMMDLDQFAMVNERFGHAGGDLALRRFAALVSGQLRSTDLFARYGGEEFCLFLSDTDEERAHEIAERLRAGVATMSIDAAGKILRFTVSIGIAPAGNAGLEEAIRRADIALYQAKELGRNRVKDSSSLGLGLGAMPRPA
jgi:diguanylate cyclase (GGDEF)-like protein